mgnify:CR=1 FL=1|tara:strand:- start:449 stop:1408 length:960 start_codon:yes stop_codon:yes gene_type:complete
MKLITMIRNVNDRKEVPMVKVNDGERDPDDPMVKVELVGEERPDEPMVVENEVDRLNNLIELYINSVVRHETELLDYKDDINGDTALIVAVKTKNEAIANALIKAGADVTIKNKDGNTALFYAIRMNMPGIYKQLAEKARETLTIGGQKLNKITREQAKDLRRRLTARRKTPYPSPPSPVSKTLNKKIDKFMYNYFLWNDGKNNKTYDKLEEIEGIGYSPEHLNNRTSPGNNFVQEVKRNSRANSYSQNPNVDNDLTYGDSEYLNKIRETEKENELYKNLGGKKRKTKKGKRGNKSKESRKGKKSRKERKSIKGKKIKR